MSLDLFAVEFGTINNDQRFSAITSFAQAQPTESNRHDFKSVWTNDAIKDVAAFANTFGGILVIGVEKNQNDHTARVVGVTSGSELTTGIASAIATNISSTPSYDIMECHQPTDPNKRFCVVRVRSDARLYLCNQKRHHIACVGQKRGSDNSG
jgi:predicted HTH transcriptional regulator